MGSWGNLQVFYHIRIKFLFGRETNEIFLAELPNRKKLTLEKVIEEHVLPGTKILTDGWAGYKDLEKKRFVTLLQYCVDVFVVCVYIKHCSRLSLGLGEP